jgi:hypothetical protein
MYYMTFLPVAYRLVAARGSYYAVQIRWVVARYCSINIGQWWPARVWGWVLHSSFSAAL